MTSAAIRRLSVAVTLCVVAAALASAPAMCKPDALLPDPACGRNCFDCLHRQLCYTCLPGYYNAWGECIRCEEGCLECMGPTLCRCCDAESGYRMADGIDDVCTSTPLPPPATENLPPGDGEAFSAFLSASPGASLEARGPAADFAAMTAPMTAPAAEPSASLEYILAPVYAPAGSEWQAAAPIGLVPLPPPGVSPPTEMCCQHMSGTYLYDTVEDPLCKRLAKHHPEYTCPVCWLNSIGHMECKDHVDDVVPRFTAIAPATLLDRINTTGTPAQAPLLLAPSISTQTGLDALPLATRNEMEAVP